MILTRRKMLLTICVVLTLSAAVVNIFMKAPEPLTVVSETDGGESGEEIPTADDSVKTDEYFDDALFVGDSRTLGFMLYSGLTKATFYTATGLSLKGVYDNPCIEYEGRKITVSEAIKHNSFGKVYIMFGINELGWPYNDVFHDKYKQFITEIAQSQPQAKLYVQTVMPINPELIKNTAEYINNERIAEYNEIIHAICDELGITCVDLYSAMADKDGNLYKNASTDGIHLNKEFCSRWLSLLKGEKLDEIIE